MPLDIAGLLSDQLDQEIERAVTHLRKPFLGHDGRLDEPGRGGAAAIGGGRQHRAGLGTHTFGFDELHEAYDVFRNAAANKALKVVISA